MFFYLLISSNISLFISVSWYRATITLRDVQCKDIVILLQNMTYGADSNTGYNRGTSDQFSKDVTKMWNRMINGTIHGMESRLLDALRGSLLVHVA